jgi:hypothetical protein
MEMKSITLGQSKNSHFKFFVLFLLGGTISACTQQRQRLLQISQAERERERLAFVNAVPSNLPISSSSVDGTNHFVVTQKSVPPRASNHPQHQDATVEERRQAMNFALEICRKHGEPLGKNLEPLSVRRTGQANASYNQHDRTLTHNFYCWQKT